jgi:predicted proteasome-type protease
MIQVKDLVVTDLSRRGNGRDEISPVRSIIEVYTKDGELLAVHDSQGNYTVEQLVAFAKLCREKSDETIEKNYKSLSKV